MPELVRQEIMTSVDMVVVKVGTRVLTQADGTLDHGQVESIAGQIAQLWQAGRKVVLVSSGAVGAGLGRLGISRRPTDVAHLQAAAAIGQSMLIESYNRALEPHQLHAAQILLTAGDLQDRTRYLNVRNALFSLFDCGAVPIINENDTVSVEELQVTFGDNDRLAALVTNLIRAPLLVLLSDVDGLYDGDPQSGQAKVQSVITDLKEARQFLVHDHAPRTNIQLSKGGMRSKLGAAEIAISAGESVVIANGRRPHVLEEILASEDVGTLIIPKRPAVDSRKRWIGWSAHPAGKLILDEGAYRALISTNSSLLAVGVSDVEGEFAKGDVVALCDPLGREFGRGLINYTAVEMRTISGQPTDRIAALLGHCPYDEVVHRDNLVVLA